MPFRFRASLADRAALRLQACPSSPSRATAPPPPPPTGRAVAALTLATPGPASGGGAGGGAGGGSSGGGASESSYTLSSAMRETSLAGLPSLLTAILLSAEQEQRAPVLSCMASADAMLPANFMSVATEVVRGMNSFARYDLTTAQEVRPAPVIEGVRGL